MNLQQRMAEVEQRIAAACERSGRKREEVQLIAVTKTIGIEQAREVIAHGLIHLGENRWQDAQGKWRAISEGEGDATGVTSIPDATKQEGPAIQWHFIGSLQTNKVKDVIGRFTYIHSLDRLSLAQAIAKRASQLGITVPCFIQVNVSGEESKHGISPDQLLSFAGEAAALPGLSLAGLMTMAPYEAEPEAARPVFRGLRELRDQLNSSGNIPYPVNGLSMGMSNDFEVAVEEGATWLRLGTILLG